MGFLNYFSTIKLIELIVKMLVSMKVYNVKTKVFPSLVAHYKGKSLSILCSVSYMMIFRFIYK